MSDWKTEARGIESWPYVRLRWCGSPALPPGVVLIYGVADLGPDDLAQCVVDLADPDVLAAFDRRLALRLGAPVEAVREGVMIFPLDEMWHVCAGYGGARPKWAWVGCVGEHEPRLDPLLFRVRAWRSVP